MLALSTVLFLSASLLLAVDVVDNRDYEGDSYEVYVLNTHVGYLYNYNFDYSLTGKTK